MAAPNGMEDTVVLQEFVKGSKVMICDPSATTRSSLSKILSDCGVRGANILLAPTFSDGKEMIRREKPKIVICEYELDNRKFGLELLQMLRSEIPELRNHLFMLVTSNSAQTSIAQAAEEDVDSYILKPFTSQVFRNAILRAVVVKTHPSPYVLTINEGKAHLTAGRMDEAISFFEKAITMDKEPSLAYAYLGQASLIKKGLDSAQAHFLKGLQANKLHYKCLIGLHETLMLQKRYQEAYELIKRIAKFYPANPSRMSSLMRLTIMTGHYDDIDDYYDIFVNIADRNEEMTRVVCSALVISGKFYATQGNTERATDQFMKAAVSSAGKPKILRDVVIAAADAKLISAAETFLAKFPPDTRNSPEFACADISLSGATEDPGRTFERVRQTIAKGIEDPMIYRYAIKFAQIIKKKDMAEDWANKARRKWPEEKFILEG